MKCEEFFPLQLSNVLLEAAKVPLAARRDAAQHMNFRVQFLRPYLLSLGFMDVRSHTLTHTHTHRHETHHGSFSSSLVVFNRMNNFGFKRLFAPGERRSFFLEVSVFISRRRR